MRLISCYIENYGGLQKFSYDFQDGLNVIFEGNGWGKSTFASFLKAMFYGLEHTTRRSLDENERKKYEPWNGGVFGGNLVFETDRGIYRVERFFGGKDKEDTFVLYDVNTGLESNAYTEKIGEELFGIDKVAFEQSIFMKQGMYAVGMTDSIAAKMGGLMASGDDMDCYEKACERIDAEMKIYKKVGNKGKLAEVAEEIAQLNRNIAEAKQTGATLADWKAKKEQCYQNIDSLKAQKEDLKVQMRKAGEQAVIREKSKHYRTLLEEKERCEHKVEEFEHFFRNGVPTEEEVEEYRNKLFLYRSEGERVSEEQQNFRYPNLVHILECSPMTEEELDACEQKWNSVIEKENLLEKKEFQLQGIRIREEEKDSYLNERADSYKAKQRVFVIFAVIALVAGVALYFTLGWKYALIAAGVMALAMVCACVFGINAKKTLAEAEDENEELVYAEEEYEELCKAMESSKKAVRMYLQVFPISSDEEIPSFISKVRISLMELKNREERQQQQQQATEKRNREKQVLREELILFLRRFYGEISEVEEYLLKEIAHKRNEYLNIREQYTTKCRQLEQTDKVEVIPVEQLLSMEELQRRETVIEKEIATKEEQLRQLNATITRYTELMEECEKWEMEKHDLEEMQEEYQKKYKLLEKTLKYLKTAQTEFSSRYLKKINQGFTKYATLIGEDKFANSQVDLKLSVQTDECGAKRSIGYFSVGLRETMELCTRFALVDALFEAEKPFVILDDPFVNLDKNAMEGAQKVLSQLATQYQLIYLTCHPSRK